MTFQIIETQEQFDEAISKRIAKVKDATREEVRKEFGDYDEVKARAESLQGQVSELTERLKANEGNAEKIAELEKKVTKYESDSAKTRIVTQLGLPLDMAKRIQGETEEEWKSDAESLKKLFGTQTTPLAHPEKPVTEQSKKDEALSGMLKEMFD